MLTTSPVTQTFVAPAELATKLLTHYSFDLNGYNAGELINLWQVEYPLNWLHLAVIEALYQGRYKAISVQQILTFWRRKGEATYHFNMEFERMICSKFPERLTCPSLSVLPPAKQEIRTEQYQHPQFPQLLPAKVSYNHQISHNSPAVAENWNAEAENTQVSQPAVIEDISPQPAQQLTPQQTANNPPIGQFTPQKSDRTESLTSKLKALTGDNLGLAF
ncbi:hypothetical protein PN480_18880 [Dolichospermum circinale CS-1225]|uniref:DnaD domain-containing protein n=1 Tax=Dolichospermum circinale CS-537/01 TaxID=3021739 RepID=A0ABT5A2G6_9CYAN|nr:hypothetical protein [Dolichospermum circinale]MDB9467816.1 hypothetical protein [Dolichospermum circinale CS-539/09]MDB9472448.1 hypothetical protein [Dolichospermum circinale CS-539]MDB9486129.1 hypothetical protein [Dolichospermum circinale CS-537/01]MDB9523993.1 hypothetical protein [Dolichospermum circinale CS-1225]